MWWIVAIIVTIIALSLYVAFRRKPRSGTPTSGRVGPSAPSGPKKF